MLKGLLSRDRLGAILLTIAEPDPDTASLSGLNRPD
jgi:hypothetical protein